jgi:uncharacterized tellurite resistance protein B-like protein
LTIALRIHFVKRFRPLAPGRQGAVTLTLKTAPFCPMKWRQAQAGAVVIAGQARLSDCSRPAPGGQNTNGQSNPMLAEIKRLFADMHIGGKHSSHFDADDCRVASAALLVHVATLEHDLTGPARQKLAALLKARFALTDALTDELVEAAMAADREAVDFYHFTHLLMRCLDEKGRLRVVEMLWEMAFADGAISEFEDTMMWRVADLLAVPPRDRIALRQQAAGQRTGAAEAAPEAAGSEPDKAEP